MKHTFTWPGYDESNPGHSSLMGFLTLDVQNASDYIQHIINTLDALKEGRIERWQGGGNAYFCELTLHGAQLKTAYDVGEDEIPLVTFDDFEQAILAWRDDCLK